MGRDYHNLEVFNAGMSQYMASTLFHIENTAEDYSTGYLQDVLFQFSSKRRRLMMSEEDERSNKLDESCWDSSLTGKKSDETISDTRTPPEETASETILYDSSSLSSHKESTDQYHQWTPAKEHLYSSAFSFGASNGKIKRMPELVQQANNKVVYPFSLIKPGGFEGVATLNDINERIVLPPTRPVRHPVGDFACRPLISSPNGPGLSGKAVVAFTRIHTQGRRGTITIIRTRS